MENIEFQNLETQISNIFTQTIGHGSVPDRLELLDKFQTLQQSIMEKKSLLYDNLISFIRDLDETA